VYQGCELRFFFAFTSCLWVTLCFVHTHVLPTFYAAIIIKSIYNRINYYLIGLQIKEVAMSDWTDFLEVAGNLATGGLWGVGGTIYNASKAAGQAGKDIEKIAAEVDQGLNQLFTSLNAMMFEVSETTRKLHEQFELARPDGRAVSEMSQDEARRLSKLQAFQTQMAQEFQTAITNYMTQIPVIMADPTKTPEQKHSAIKTLADAMILAQNKLKYINKLIGQILYEEPGPIPLTTEHIEDILNRIDTLEMPRFETILDDAAGNLVETEGLVKDVRRLLWIPAKKEKTALTETDQAAIARHQHSAQLYGTLLERSQQAHAHFVDRAVQLSMPQVLPGNDGQPALAGDPPPEAALPAATEMAASNAKDNSVAVLLKQHNWLAGQVIYLQCEQEKSQQAVEALKLDTTLQPGVIPQTIEALHQSIDHFHQQEQPRLDTLLTSLNQTVLAAQATLQETDTSVAQARISLGIVQGILTNRWVKIGAIACASLFGLILLFSAITLFRVAFGI
jgi:hypothetical protein